MEWIVLWGVRVKIDVIAKDSAVRKNFKRQLNITAESVNSIRKSSF